MGRIKKEHKMFKKSDISKVNLLCQFDAQDLNLSKKIIINYSNLLETLYMLILSKAAMMDFHSTLYLK